MLKSTMVWKKELLRWHKSLTQEVNFSAIILWLKSHSRHVFNIKEQKSGNYQYFSMLGWLISWWNVNNKLFYTIPTNKRDKKGFQESTNLSLKSKSINQTAKQICISKRIIETCEQTLIK
jgi:hypothetical protein